MRVYLRLQADAKWYDTSEEDIRQWFLQLAPDGYERNKKNAEHSIKKLQYLVSLIEEGQQKQQQRNSDCIEEKRLGYANRSVCISQALCFYVVM